MAEINCPNCNGKGWVPGELELWKKRDGQPIRIRPKKDCPICGGHGKVEDR